MYERARIIRAPLPPRIRFIVKSWDKSAYWNVCLPDTFAGTALKCLLLVCGEHGRIGPENAPRPIWFFLSFFFLSSLFLFLFRPFRKAVKHVQTSVVCRAKINFLLRFHCEGGTRMVKKKKGVSLITTGRGFINFWLRRIT